jgi:hypothetical protein
MNEIKKIVVSALVGIMVLIGVIFYMLGTENLDLSGLLLVILPIILVIGVGFILKDRISNVRAGLPVEDERAKKLGWKAGAYTYFCTIWLAVGSLWYNIVAESFDLPQLDSTGIIAVIVLGSGIIWLILYMFFTRKGDVE